MQTKKSSFNCNPLPTLLAALLTEQGTSQAKDIAIHPVEGQPSIALREIVDTKRSPVDGSLSILVRSKSEERVAVEQELPEQHDLRGLIPIFERERTLLQIDWMLRERAHTLGLSPLQPAFFPETKAWEEEQQKILSFFLPYGSQIRGDLVLTGKCLEAALQQPIELSMIAPKQLAVAGTKLDDNNVNLDCLAGGLCTAVVTCVQVQIGPVPLADLIDFVPGGTKRRFLEEALLVHLLPSEWDWNIIITVEKLYEKFQVADNERPLRVDIHSFVE